MLSVIWSLNDSWGLGQHITCPFGFKHMPFLTFLRLPLGILSSSVLWSPESEQPTSLSPKKATAGPNLRFYQSILNILFGYDHSEMSKNTSPKNDPKHKQSQNWISILRWSLIRGSPLGILKYFNRGRRNRNRPKPFHNQKSMHTVDLIFGTG